MRAIKFRAWDINHNCMEIIDNLYWFEENGVETFEGSGHHSKYILEQFTGLLDKNGKEIYEGDIVKVLTNRVAEYSPEWAIKSSHDAIKIESRSIVVFSNFEWRLKTDTEYNLKTLELKGSEKDKRRLTVRDSLNNYDFFQKENPSGEWNRVHNSHVYWCDIEVVGNIHENPELLNANS